MLVNDVDGTLDKTYAEIDTAMRDGTLVLIKYADEVSCTLVPVNFVCKNNKYGVYCTFVDIGATPYTTVVWEYATETEDGYPTFVEN